MYDVNFFMRTFGLKNDILAGRYGPDDADAVYHQLAASLAPTPRVFNVETTNHCNMRCMMCQRTTDLQRPLHHMDPAVFAALAEQITPAGDDELQAWADFVASRLNRTARPSENNFYFDVIARAVTLHGFGEPLLDPRLPERVDRLSQRSIPSYFSCNPCNIRLSRFEELFRAGLGWVKFALDSLDDAEARRIRGPRADYTRSARNILDLLELKARLGVTTRIVLTMLDFSGDLGPDSQAERFLRLWEDKDVYAYVKSVDNKWLLRKKGALEQARGQDRSHYARQYCEYPWTSVTVLADGSVVPCTQDINGAWTMGNVREQSLAEIWLGPKFQEFRRMQVLGTFPKDFMCHARCDQQLVAYALETAHAPR